MGKIGPSKHTKPERIVRMWLVRNRIRHRCHWKLNNVSVDLWAVSKVNSEIILIAVDGRFWHCPRSKASRISQFWEDKIKRNVMRDARNRRRLNRAGFKLIRIWDSDLKNDGWKRRLSRILMG